MSDAQLRELERAWRQSGSVDDEARWLAGRQQRGLLTRERLQLAGWLGHEAAALAADRPLCPETRLPLALRGGRTGLPTQRDLAPWVRGLDPLGAPVVRRLVVALVARHVERLPLLPATLRVARACQEAAIRYTLTPEDEAVRRHLREVVARTTPTSGRPAIDATAVLRLMYLLAVDSIGGGAETGGGAVRASSLAAVRELLALHDDFARARALDELRGAFAGQLVPWALGAADPLVAPRDRVDLGSLAPPPAVDRRLRERQPLPVRWATVAELELQLAHDRAAP